MRVTVKDAESQLDELVMRAEAGDEVILTVEGRAAVRLVPISAAIEPARDAQSRRALLEEIQSEAVGGSIPGPSAAHSQDFLYDGDGLPK